MSMTEIVLHDPSQLDVVTDPAAVVVAMLDNAKALLAQASRLEDVAEWKARAVGLEGYVRQRDLGKEAELSAQEIVRRAERRIGELIREGQAAGEIRDKGQRSTPPSDRVDNPIFSKPGPKDFVSENEWRGNDAGIVDMTDDVEPEQFEEALTEAKAEGNLSRANVVRKVRQVTGKEPRPEPGAPKSRTITAAEVDAIRDMAGEGWTTRQIASRLDRSEQVIREHSKRHGIDVHADTVVGKTRRHDSNRIVAETVHACEGAAFGLDLIDYTDLDRTQIAGWVDSLTASIRSLNQMRNQLAKTMKEQTQ